MWWTHELVTASSHEHRNRGKQAQKEGFKILTEGNGQMLLEIRSSAGMWESGETSSFTGVGTYTHPPTPWHRWPVCSLSAVFDCFDSHQ